MFRTTIEILAGIATIVGTILAVLPSKQDRAEPIAAVSPGRTIVVSTGVQTPCQAVPVLPSCPSAKTTATRSAEVSRKGSSCH